MIVVKVVGGLGHQIGCYAFGRICADSLGVPLKLDLSAYKDCRLHAYGLDRFLLDAEVATEAEIAAARKSGVVAERTLLFDTSVLDDLRDGIYLDGSWGDYRYTEERIQALRERFVPCQDLEGESAVLLEQIRTTQSVSLHVRRGDYVTNPNCFLLPMTYYDDAIREVLQRFPTAHVFVFSDDPDWAERNLAVPCPHTIVRIHDAGRNVEDLQLMRSCRHHINANSSFSYWAARLDPKPGGHVIAPQQYFKADDPYLAQTFGGVVQPVWPPEWEVQPVRATDHLQSAEHYLDIAGGDSRDHPIRVGVWNYYEEITTDGFLFKHPDVSIGHNLLKPWMDLYTYGQAHGLEFLTLDQVHGPEELDALLFQDRPRRDNPRLNRFLDSRLPKYLSIWETEMIKPDNWEHDYHTQFQRIFTWNDDLVDHQRYIKMNSAMDPESPYDFDVLKTAFLQRKLCTLIAGAKQASHPCELYSERVNAIRWFETHAPGEFDLYGIGWNPAAFPSYRGPVRDKLAALARYRFAICYENARNYPGYITEKILDCFRAGVVPVYLGAPNVDRWIPRDCYIDLNDFRNYEHLYAHLSSMSGAEHGVYLDRIREFLGSEQVYPFTTESLITSLTGYLVRDIRTSRGEVPDVTVAIPAYNYGRFLGLALESALSQEVERLEVLVLDNASTDATPAVIAKYAGNPKLRWMRNTRNIGGTNNWMNAEKIASGRYMTFLSADDFYLPGHLARMVQVMDKNPEISLAYCPCVWVDEASKPLYVLNHPGHAVQDYVGGRNEVADLLRFDCYITPSATLMRRTALDAVGSFDRSLTGAGDWDLWIRIAERAPDFAFFKEPKVCYRVHPGQDTAAEVSSANILVDHIRILWNAMERGSLPHFRDSAGEVMELLERKYRMYPEERVAHLRPHLRRLEGLIKGGQEADFRTARLAVEAEVEQSLGHAARSGTFKGPTIREDSLNERRRQQIKGTCHVQKDAFLFEPDWESGAWIEVLLAYLEAYRPGEPVLLVFALDPGRTGQLDLEQAQGEMARVARQVASAEIPDIALVDKPEELLVVLRGYGQIQWVPRAGEGSAELAGPQARRFSDALARLRNHR